MKVGITRWIVASVGSPRTEEFNGQNYQGWTPCIRWCEQQFGIERSTWRYDTEGVFLFANENDHLLFLLRWA